ncbi:TIGR03619 family F420-dependent LLM class oxidoreductase [Spongiibacter nanhainus]|uniref:TIGR03619 family F420-dependent LLM class oxidoreductase n=1 Tax=Spongiibacter nanhainus TaxID=2794344 RepID=A0A7T4URN2_9GAMM|nr:TIGR03619 family F420-dependent LLM class oxidoreductase [Spongiibacter nanhainus]QQD19911.1 TIGR03619 family F420-dependent LLM class oxidoreductase [Spongiibacter nanhainus]
MKFVLSGSFCELTQLSKLAVTADQCGWEAISFSDHVANLETLNTPYPYTDDGSRRWEPFTDWPDPWVMTAALASLTERLKFTNNIFVLPMRNPFLVAKAIATAAVMSGNRVIPAIGVGWSKDEFTLLEQDFHTRGKRCDEILDILPLLWSGEMVSYSGRYYSFPRLEMNPAPGGPIPIWVGGISDAAMRRAARAGDGWVSDLQSSEEILASVAKIRDYRREYDREDRPFSVMATPSDAFTVEGYRELEAGGVTHILTQPWPFYYGNTDDVAERCEGIRRFAQDIIAKFD